MFKKYFWYGCMAGEIVLWVASVVVGHLLFPDNKLLAWAPFAVLFAVHVSEIKMCLGFCKTYGISKKAAVAKAMLFGFTWWIPLKRGIIEK